MSVETREDTKARPSLIPRLGIGARLRAYFFAGVVVVAPVSITFYIAWKFISFVDGQVSPLIPPAILPQHWALPGVGLVIAVVGLTLVGALTANFVGRLVVRISEAILTRMPVIRGIYSAVKQIFDTIFGQKAEAFREVVLVEYPRAGAWTIAFVTGQASGEIKDAFADEMVSVFVPTTPNPTSGFLLFVPKADLRPLAMTVEEGLKMVVSMGVLTPAGTPAAVQG
ncbi:hypothetical protein A6A04_08925 [Paramagnetospirillum marisnigri]|uniref:DUF502 domain-containing protein n=1 Tax=Paramagnetospirillum marisnigri TaxID=1285242 RepID=A0A178M7X6_9PROT|nr:DUF502 domain-containing protein [Paramagnetospirillum marisnigri]OAN43994.1 hypothetical protein A6A04_08925 [Paramagnetospirillum marisnigri]